MYETQFPLFYNPKEGIAPSIGVAVITYAAKDLLPFCLPRLFSSKLKPKVLVVNSTSNDGTVEVARGLGADILLLPTDEFNHGLTREKARRHLNTDIVVMMTPDAYPAHDEMLEALVLPLITGVASVSYARQLPHEGANFFEAFAREFNYPKTSHLRSVKDIDTYGIYTYFCSDSCAAYVSSALDAIGGFDNVLSGEDTVAVAKLLPIGGKVAYVAAAMVKHSHGYTLLQEFRRHFDTGYARKQYRHLFCSSQGDHRRGAEYTRSLFKKTWKEKKELLPYAFLQTIVKYCGYALGQRSVRWPKWIAKRFSGQTHYWK